MSINRFKEGAASFYIVAFSTLILMIVAVSFATVIISEVERTSNDDLSQSAYDSALAGIEDAKLAYFNYQNCMAQEGVTPMRPNDDWSVTCPEILWYMEQAKNNTTDDCELVWKILGKSDINGNRVGGEVVETTGDVDNNMQQATTCVTMTNTTPDYRGTLSASNMVDVIKLSFADGVTADDISSMKLKWFSRDDAIRILGDKNDAQLNYMPPKSFSASPVQATVPVVSLTVLQTGPGFTMDSFNQTSSTQNWTNRGTLYFTPQANNSSQGSIPSSALVNSNAKKVQNEPYTVNCASAIKNIVNDYACSVGINLPKPIGGVRSDDTFEVIVSMPYGQPSTEFLLEFYCNNGANCGSQQITNGDGTKLVSLENVQIEVDSTGRANDLYRRVITRLKSKNDMALSVIGPLELLDADDGYGNAGMTKNLTVTKEYDFEP